MLTTLLQKPLQFNRSIQLSFDGLTGDFLKAKLRKGSDYTSNGAADFLKPLLNHYNDTFPETSVLVRGDSGFAMPSLYELCQNQSVYYLIRLKLNSVLAALAEDYPPSGEIKDVTQAEYHLEDTVYQAKSWSKERRVILQSVRPAGELFFSHTFSTIFSSIIATNTFSTIEIH